MMISAQIQFIPLLATEPMAQVDTAIELIENSGLPTKWGRLELAWKDRKFRYKD